LDDRLRGVPKPDGGSLEEWQRISLALQLTYGSVAKAKPWSA
jgi:hypothetical protein